MKRAVAAVVVILVSGWSSGCGLGCSPTGPSGQAVSFAGSIGGGGLVYHDVTVPSNTDSVNVSVQWTPAEAQVRLTQIDPNCDPTQSPSCQRLTDPQGNSSQSTQSIAGRLFHQGSNATGRVRFILQNLTADTGASYTATATPQRHGCDR